MIHHKEMYALIICCLTWGESLRGRTVLMYCDNAAVVDVITAARGRDKILMKLLRELWFCCAQYSFQVTALHVPGVDNPLADAVSRDDMARARRLRPSLEISSSAPVLPSMQW